MAITRLKLKLSIDETEPVTGAAGDVGRKVSRHRLIFLRSAKVVITATGGLIDDGDYNGATRLMDDE